MTDETNRKASPPDALAIAFQTVREELLRQEPANEAVFADALADAELRARRILGGARHYIQRLPAAERVAMVELLPANLTPTQVAQRLGIPRQTASWLLAQARRKAGVR